MFRCALVTTARPASAGLQATLPQQIEQAAWAPEVPSWTKQVPEEGTEGGNDQG